MCECKYIFAKHRGERESDVYKFNKKTFLSVTFESLMHRTILHASVPVHVMQNTPNTQPFCHRLLLCHSCLPSQSNYSFSGCTVQTTQFHYLSPVTLDVYKVHHKVKCYLADSINMLFSFHLAALHRWTTKYVARNGSGMHLPVTIEPSTDGCKHLLLSVCVWRLLVTLTGQTESLAALSGMS